MTEARWSPPRWLIAVGGDVTEEQVAALRHAAAACQAEPGAVLVRPTARTPALLAGLPSLPVVAVLPDLPQLLRDVAERGAPCAAGSRLAAGGLAACWRLARTGLRHLPDIARKDFRGIVPVLIELERARAGQNAPQGVALAAPVTDLLLSAGHADCLGHVVSFLRRSGTRAGFETQNLGHLLTRLASWGVAPDFVIGPMNPRGFRMKPSASAVLAAVRRAESAVLASEPSAAGTVPLADAVAYVREHGAAGVVISPADLAGAADGWRPA